MTIKYVYSGAAGANDGTSWANAWTSLSSSTGVAAGDFVYVHKTHSEAPASFSANWSNGTQTNRVKLICVDKDNSDALSTGAAVSPTGNLALDGHVYCYGINFSSGGQLTWEWVGGKSWIADSSNMTLTGNSNPIIFGSTSNTDKVILLRGCTFSMSGMGSSSRKLEFQAGGNFHMIGGSFVGVGGGQTTLAYDGGTSAALTFENVDISGTFTNLYEITTGTSKVTLRRCSFGTITNWRTAALNGLDSFILVEGCANGSITLPQLLTHYERYVGTIKASLSRYRTGGANDGLQANAYSWEMTTNSSALEIYSFLESPPLTRWLAADASISGATAKGIHTSTRCAPLATPAALTTDGTSTWNGTGVGTKQKITHTLTNGSTLTVYVASGGTLNNDDFWIEVSEPDQVGGPVSVRCFLAKPSTTVYVDSRLAVNDTMTGDGLEYFAEGVQISEIQPEDQGGGGQVIIRRGGLVCKL